MSSGKPGLWAALLNRLSKAASGQVVATRSLSDLAQQLAPRNELLSTPQSNPERDKALDQAGMRNLWPFSPGQPLPPFYPELPPRQFQYNVGQNISTTPRSEITGAVAFSVLRNMSRIYDVARMCINLRIEELAHLDFDIVPRQEEDKGKYDDACRRARQFFEKPDGVTPWDRWVAMVAEDWLAIDAVSIYRHYNRAGNKLVALEVVDGTTVKPLLDARGRVPLPPAPALQQWMWGLPIGEFTIQQLIYRPHWVRSDSPYGFPPMEWLLLNVNTDVKFQWYFLNFFTEGNVPEGFIQAPEAWSPQQIREFQEYWDALMSGNEQLKRTVRMIPGGSQGAGYVPTKDPKWDTQFGQWLLQKTCAAYGVSPQELGFVQQINRSQGEMQQNVQQRRSLKPATSFIASIVNQVLAEDFGLPQLEMKFLGLDEEEDALAKAQRMKIYVEIGAISPDEVRSQELGLQVDAHQPAGRVFLTAQGPIPIEEIYSAAPAETGSQPDAAATGDQAGKAPADEPGKDGNAPSDHEKSPVNGEPPGRQLPAPPKQEERSALADDLRKWQRKALDRLKAGRKAACDFDSPAIPPGVKQAVVARLATANTPDEIRSIFAKAALPREPRLPRKKININQPTRKLIKLRRTLAADLAAFLAAEGEAITKHVTASDAPVQAVDGYDWTRWAALIAAITQSKLAPIHRLGGETALDALNAYGTFTLRHEDAEEYARARAAELVGKRVLPDGTIIDNPNPKWAITESTREWIRRDVTDALAEGLSMDDMANQLQANYAFSAARAETIARTETGFAYNRGTISGYRQTGLVQQVEVLDGDYDEECQAANGQVWTLEEAEANPLEHPNCVRSFSPIVVEEEEE